MPLPMCSKRLKNSTRTPTRTTTLDLRDVTFVMLGNPDRNDGGLRARLPAGVYVPFLGLSFGASTNPVTPTDDPNAPRVILITKQYDGVADVPKYMLLDPLADINWALGLFYEHNYQDVDLDLDDDGDVDETDVTMAEARTPRSSMESVGGGDDTEPGLRRRIHSRQRSRPDSADLHRAGSQRLDRPEGRFPAPPLNLRNTGSRRPAQISTAYARLPTPPHRMHRRHRLGTSPNHPSRLTTYEPGMST